MEEAAAADGDCECCSHGHGEAGRRLRVLRPGDAARAGAVRAGRAAGRVGRGVPQGPDRGRAGGPGGRAAGGGGGAAGRPKLPAKVRAGQAPRGRMPQEAAVAAAQIALERAVAAQQAKRDAYDQRAAAGQRVRGTRPVRRSRPRWCGVPGRLAAVRKAGKAPAGAAPGRARTRRAARGGGSGTKSHPSRCATSPTGLPRDALHPHGTVQAYSCQLPRCDDGLILAARATRDANDAAQVEATLADITAAQETIAAGTLQAGPPGLVPHRHRRLRRRVLQQGQLPSARPGPADQRRIMGISRKQRAAHPGLPAPGPPRPDGRWPVHPAGPRHLPAPRAAVRGRVQLPERQDRAPPVLHARPAPCPGRAHPRRDRQGRHAAPPRLPSLPRPT